jgi:hypothetical protein
VIGLAFLLLQAASVRAFPPAPHHTLFGMVRNEWGTPINVAGATVVIQTGNGLGVTAVISPSSEPGVNYRLVIPMDAGTTLDLYQSTALRRGQPFQLRVQIGNLTYLPLEMVTSTPQLGPSAGSTRLDLTLGEDSDHDGLPDAWEQAIISVLGGTLASITPEGDADGDGISNLNEYLAGTFAFDPHDGFRLSIARVDGEGTTLEFLGIRGRTYSIQASFDLKQWTPVNFSVVSGGVGGPLQGSYLSPDVRNLQFKVPFQSGGESNRYFKAVVQ